MSTPVSYVCRGLRCAGQQFGVADGAKILALHGWMDNSNTYAQLAPYLPDVCLVALDLPGHGHSAHRSPDAQYHFVDWVGDVMDAAAALGWERFTLMGHSMGAAVATLCAACYPDAIDKLVLLDGIGPLSREAKEGPRHLVQHRQQVARLEIRSPTAYPTLAHMARALARVVPGLSEAGAHTLLERGAMETELGFVSRCDRRLRATSLFALTEPQVMAFLQQVVCPTLLVRPTQGFPFGDEQMRTRCTAFKDLQVVRLQGGHHLHLEDAPRLAPHLRAFLQLARNAA